MKFIRTGTGRTFLNIDYVTKLFMDGKSCSAVMTDDSSFEVATAWKGEDEDSFTQRVFREFGLWSESFSQIVCPPEPFYTVFEAPGTQENSFWTERVALFGVTTLGHLVPLFFGHPDECEAGIDECTPYGQIVGIVRSEEEAAQMILERREELRKKRERKVK